MGFRSQEARVVAASGCIDQLDRNPRSRQNFLYARKSCELVRACFKQSGVLGLVLDEATFRYETMQTVATSPMTDAAHAGIVLQPVVMPEMNVNMTKRTHRNNELISFNKNKQNIKKRDAINNTQTTHEIN